MENNHCHRVINQLQLINIIIIIIYLFIYLFIIIIIIIVFSFVGGDYCTNTVSCFYHTLIVFMVHFTVLCF